MMQFDFEERLGWLDVNHYKYGKEVEVIEQEEAGKAKVLVASNSQLLTVRKNGIRYLKQQKVADGLVCKLLENDMEVHIIECKKTATDSQWSKAKKQFEGGLLNSFALCGLLNKNISRVIFYTAFREDKIDSKNTTNPVLLKSTIGTKEKTGSIDWNLAKINILNRKFEHIKIQLDGKGEGEVFV